MESKKKPQVSTRPNCTEQTTVNLQQEHQYLAHKLEEASTKGVEKYNTPVHLANLSAVQWLEHDIEETIDGLIYKMQLLNKLRGDPNYDNRN